MTKFLKAVGGWLLEFIPAVLVDLLLGKVILDKVQGDKKSGSSAGFRVNPKDAASASGPVLKKVLFEEDRVAFVEDLKILGVAAVPKMMRRHREAVAAHTENRLVALICKFPKSETEGRRPYILWMEGLSDAEFEQVLDILEHNPLPQALARIADYLGEKGKKLHKEVMKQLRKLNRVAADVADAVEGLPFTEPEWDTAGGRLIRSLTIPAPTSRRR